jgi:hypothetical protein
MKKGPFLVCLLIPALLLIPFQALSTEDPPVDETTDDPAAIPGTEEPADPALPEDPAAALPSEEPADPIPPEDPATDLPSEEDPSEVTRYTIEEFDALADDAKRDVYFNYPEQLPEDFDAQAYADIFYPAEEPGT